jgi:rubrerythrin
MMTTTATTTAPTVVTKASGGRTWALGATFTDPNLALTPDEAVEFAADSGLEGFFFVDILSCFLGHERDGVHLYRTVAGLTSNAALRAAFEEFGAETAEHVDIYERLVMALGGDPAYVSPSARLNEFANTKLLEGLLLSNSVDVVMFDVALVEAVGAAEAKCEANWMFLAELAAELPASSAARTAIEAAVGAVLQQEEKHRGWATRTRNELLRAMSFGLDP